MRINNLKISFLCIAFGGFIAFDSYQTIIGYQSFFGQLTRFFFLSEQQDYYLAILMSLVGASLFFLGFVSLTYGLVTTGKGEDLFFETMKESERNFNLHFKHCPLCYSEGSVNLQWTPEAKDYAICSECGAKWHLYYRLTGFRWAKLEKVNIEGKGTELLGKECNTEFWQRLALTGRKKLTNISPSKIYCAQCGAENIQDSYYCLKCGTKIIES